MNPALFLQAAVFFSGFGPPPPHGAPLATWNGLTAYFQDATKSSARGEFGLEWQCVELVNRYLVSKGHRNLERTGHAVTYYEKAEEKGLVRFPNNGTSPPEPGDLIVFKNPSLKNGYGHVALITEVGEDYVRTLQQNGGYNPSSNIVVRTDPVMRLRMTRENGEYRVQPYKPTNMTLGWVRMPAPGVEVGIGLPGA